MLIHSVIVSQLSTALIANANGGVTNSKDEIDEKLVNNNSNISTAITNGGNVNNNYQIKCNKRCRSNKYTLKYYYYYSRIIIY